MWKTILIAKYGVLGFSSTCSSFWSGVLKHTDAVELGLTRHLGNGSTILFWKDRWCSELPLSALYPNLFMYTLDPDLLIAEAFVNSSWQLLFTRQLTGILYSEWHNLLTHLQNFVPNLTMPDTLYWRWSSVGKFTVHSFYQWLEFGGIKNITFKTIWLSKMPLKIKIFLYLLKRDKILTKGNLIKRGWQGDPSCPFCGEFESTDHLFVQCAFVNSIWQWIGSHNNFFFAGTVMDDVWFLNACIPLKHIPLVEFVRGAVLWIIWLERNKICFQETCIPSLKSVGSKIISLVKFWCNHTNTGSLLQLSLILPMDTNDLNSQDLIPLMSEEENTLLEELVEEEVLAGETTPMAPGVLIPMCGTIQDIQPDLLHF